MSNSEPGGEFSARMESLADALAVVSVICGLAGLDRKAQLRIELAVEEVFTNIVPHGYEKLRKRSLWTDTNLNSRLLFITFQDI